MTAELKVKKEEHSKKAAGRGWGGVGAALAVVLDSVSSGDKEVGDVIGDLPSILAPLESIDWWGVAIVVLTYISGRWGLPGDDGKILSMLKSFTGRKGGPDV